MKIIRKGQLPKNRTFQFECTYCATIFQCEEKETSRGFDQKYKWCIYSTCPFCQCGIYGPESLLEVLNSDIETSSPYDTSSHCFLSRIKK